MQVDLHIENAEPLVKNMFGHQTHNTEGESNTQSQKQEQEKEVRRAKRKTGDGHRRGGEACSSGTSSYLNQARAMVRTP